jgi:hypothetical protein
VVRCERRRSEDECVCASLLLLGDLLEVRVDDGYGKEDSSSASDGSHEVCEDAEGTNANTTEGSSGDDVSTEVLDHGFFAVAISNDHVLLHQLVNNITRR